MPRDASDLLHGTLDVLVLKALSLGARHGYAVSEWIEQHGDGDLVIVDAALYKALHRLEDVGAIEAEWGVSENNRKAKYYSLTTRGRAQLRAETATWRRYASAVGRIHEATCPCVPRAASAASFGFRPLRTVSREISTKRSRFTSSGASHDSSRTACRTTKRAPRRCGDSGTPRIYEPIVTTSRGRICSECTRPNERRA